MGKWKKMREMDAQIKALKAKESAIDAALDNRHERIVASVEASIREVRDEIEQNQAKMCSGLAPVVQRLAMDQMDLKSKLDENFTPALFGFASQQSELVAKIDNILAPMVHRLSLEQIELKDKLASIDVESISANCESSATIPAPATNAA